MKRNVWNPGRYLRCISHSLRNGFAVNRQSGLTACIPASESQHALKCPLRVHPVRDRVGLASPGERPAEERHGFPDGTHGR